MSKIYYLEYARGDVGESQDWEIGRKASLEKWREVRRNGYKNYRRDEICGFCLVAKNRGCGISPECGYGNKPCREHCPACKLCIKIYNEKIESARRIIRMIKDLKIKKERRKR